MTKLVNTQFYMKNQVRAWLAGLAASREGQLPFAEGDCFVIEMIDRPYRCVINAGCGMVSVKLYIRGELGMYDPNRGDVELTLFAGMDAPFINDFGRVEDAEKVITSYYDAAVGLAMLLKDTDERNVFAAADPAHEGYVVKREEDAPVFRHVAGRKRPSLLCNTLFDGDKLVRPYADEVQNLWQREEKSIEELLAEAEAGDEEAMGLVAAMYLQEEPREAIRWYERLAEEDDAEGQYQLGMLLLKGECVRRDIILALGWLERAAYNDHASAEVYADFCRRMVDLEDGVSYGDPYAMGWLAEEYMNLGLLLENGGSFFEEAMTLAKRAMTGDVPVAMWVLGQLHELGLGVDENMEIAIGYYERGCALGHPGCKHSMGKLYLHGDYLIGDVEKGIAMCLEAANLGWAPAMLTVGDCYQFGDGVPSSMKTAVEWYEKYMELHEDGELRHQVSYIRSVAGLVDDCGMAAPFEMQMEEENDPFAGFSIFGGGDPFAKGSLMSGEPDLDAFDFLGGDSFSVTPEVGTTEPMFDDLIWTRLRAEAGDEEAIALLKALGETIE